MWKRVAFDAETDGLLADATVLHSLVLKDLDSGERLSCTDAGDPAVYYDIHKGLALLSAADRLYAHNLIGFDYPVLRKLYPEWDTKAELMDTMIVCQLRWAHIKDLDFALYRQQKIDAANIGRHTLKAWGQRLGIHKTEYEGSWEEWNEEMQTYCEQDVEVLAALVAHIAAHRPPELAIRTEQALRAYLVQQEINGVPFSLQAAVALQGEIAQAREGLRSELVDMVEPWFVPNGEVTPKRDRTVRKRHGQPIPPETYVAGCAYTKIKLVEFNPGSRHMIANRLKALYDWKPEVFTPSGEAEISESSLRGLDFPIVDKLQEYLMLTKRLGQIAEGKENWIGHATDNAQTGLFHIHGRVKQNDCITHRAAHSHPNLGQVVSNDKRYGIECRSLFTVPNGWVMLGSDAAGLEARCLAHYMARWDDGSYGDVVLDGDVHSVNMEALGLTHRPTAKTWFYAYLYGAGDLLLGTHLLGPAASEAKRKAAGKRARSRFESNLPALRYLVQGVKQQAKAKGYVKLIDGRRCYIRSEHAALNSLLQGTGAVICKSWIVEFNRRLHEEFGSRPGGGWDQEWAAMLWVHDEVQLAVREEYAPLVAKILVESIQAMTLHYDFRLPLDGESKIGNNWSETH